MAHKQDLTFDKIFTNGDFERLQTLADATLRTDDGSIFNVHRMLLTYRNDYFSTLFCNDTTEEDEFTIPDIDGKLLDLVLIYLYTDNISLTEENVADVLLASNRFKVDDLMSRCQEFATRNINIANCLRLFIVAFEIGDSTLINTCYRYVKVHFGKVMQESGNTIGDMKFEALEKILGDENLNVTSEKVTWWAAVKWVEKRQHERLSFVPNIVKHIFSKELDTDVKIEILTHPLVKNCKDRNSKYISKSSEAPLVYLKEDIKPVADIRKSSSPLHVNFIVRYRNVDENNHTVQLYLTYDHQVDMWRHVGDIDFWPDSLVRIKQKIYMFNALQDRRMAFDMLNETFTHVSPMSMARFHYRVAALENRIYACGGGTEANEATSILESYDPETDEWNLQRPMVPMVLSDVAVLDGRIFAIGADEMIPEMIFQVYDPTSDSWDKATAPSVYRHQFASAIFQGHLYIIGGYQSKIGHMMEFETVKIVEAYDPPSDTWKYIPSLPLAYMSPKAVVLDQKLLVFDNVYKSMYSGVCHPPVSWDPDNETWEVVSPGSWLIDIHLYHVYVVEDRELLKELLSRNRSPKVHWVQSFLNLSTK